MVVLFYDKFMKKIKEEYNDNEKVLELLSDARELENYGERRIALENLLENLLEINIKLNAELIDCANEAFSDAKSEYDKELINDLKNNCL